MYIKFGKLANSPIVTALWIKSFTPKIKMGVFIKLERTLILLVNKKWNMYVANEAKLVKIYWNYFIPKNYMYV